MADAQGAKNVHFSIKTAFNKIIDDLKNRRVDHNVRSVQSDVNRNVKYREP